MRLDHNVRLKFTLLLVVVAALHARDLNAQVDQRALGQQLLHGNAAERSRAVRAAKALSVQNIGPELRRALITALDRESEIRAQRWQAGTPWRDVRVA